MFILVIMIMRIIIITMIKTTASTSSASSSYSSTSSSTYSCSPVSLLAMLFLDLASFPWINLLFAHLKWWLRSPPPQTKQQLILERNTCYQAYFRMKISIVCISLFPSHFLSFLHQGREYMIRTVRFARDSKRGRLSTTALNADVWVQRR